MEFMGPRNERYNEIAEVVERTKLMEWIKSWHKINHGTIEIMEVNGIMNWTGCSSIETR